MALRSLCIIAFFAVSFSSNTHLPTTIAHASAADAEVLCSPGWFHSSMEGQRAVPAEKINDGYCDCPTDGADEPETGACAGSMDGMWAGIPPSLAGLGSESAHGTFTCPQQPQLRLPLSRFADGICDCCDGADESFSASCVDNCDTILADGRAAHAKAEQEYTAGAKARESSMREFLAFWDKESNEVRRLKDVELTAAGKESEEASQSQREVKLEFAREWIRAVREMVESPQLADIFGGEQHTAAVDLATFVISLCQLAGEISKDNVKDGRCLALDRASLALAMLWDNGRSTDSQNGSPTFRYINEESVQSLELFANMILADIEGSKHDGPEHDDYDEMDGIEEDEDEHFPDYGDELPDDDMFGDELNEEGYDNDFSAENSDDERRAANNIEATTPDAEEDTPDRKVVDELLGSIPLLSARNFFRKRGETLLEFFPQKDLDRTSDEESSDAETIPSDVIDPKAVSKAKTYVRRQFANILRGTNSAESAAKYLASLLSDKEFSFSDLQHLAILVMYHSDVSVQDVAELIYTNSNNFAIAAEEGVCVPPWNSMCPPRIIPMVGGKESENYPPPIITETAEQRCRERESASVFCTVGDSVEENDFPDPIPDGFLNYYQPQSRDSDDALAPLLSPIDSLYSLPSTVINANERNSNAMDQIKSIQSQIKKHELNIAANDTGNTKFGRNGELYSMQNSCHKVEYGKYEYELCIFGAATQRDLGQHSGGTNLGRWKGIQYAEGTGERVMKWDGGAKCWNGPARSAEVQVTCGAETKVLTADEPATCRYVFTMESPIGCDEHFRQSNELYAAPATF